MADEQVDVGAVLQQRKDAKQARMKSISDLLKPDMIRVNPRDDGVRKFMKHQPSGLSFPESGPAEWPNDQFTIRRLRDGALTLEEGGASPQVQKRSQQTQSRQAPAPAPAQQKQPE